MYIFFQGTYHLTELALAGYTIGTDHWKRAPKKTEGCFAQKESEPSCISVLYRWVGAAKIKGKKSFLTLTQTIPRLPTYWEDQWQTCDLNIPTTAPQWALKPGMFTSYKRRKKKVLPGLFHPSTPSCPSLALALDIPRSGWPLYRLRHAVGKVSHHCEGTWAVCVFYETAERLKHFCWFKLKVMCGPTEWI